MNLSEWSKPASVHMYMTVIYLYHMLLQGKLSHRDEGKEDQTSQHAKQPLAHIAYIYVIMAGF